MAITLIYGLVTDQGKDKHTILKFKNEVFQHIKPEWEKSYREILKEVKFDSEIERNSKKAKEIRHKFIAHRLFKKNTQELTDDVGGLAVSELRKVCEGIKNIFNACSFGSGYATTFLDFTNATIGGKPTQTHLDDIFELIVKNSGFFNEPEEKSAYWERIRDKKSPEELEILNYWRKKLGKHEA